MNILNIVLIETLWNVKVSSGNSYSLDSFGINRNIVECKEAYGLAKGIQRIVLIETSWNVKRYVAVIVAEPVFCINRNIVECKVIYNILYCFNTSY